VPSTSGKTLNCCSEGNPAGLPSKVWNADCVQVVGIRACQLPWPTFYVREPSWTESSPLSESSVIRAEDASQASHKATFGYQSACGP